MALAMERITDYFPTYKQLCCPVLIYDVMHTMFSSADETARRSPHIVLRSPVPEH